MKKRLNLAILIILIISAAMIFFVSNYSSDKKDISLSPPALTFSMEREFPAGSKNFISAVNIVSSGIQEVKFQFDGVNSTYYDDDLVLRYNFNNLPDIGESSTKVVDLSRNANNGNVNSIITIGSGMADFSQSGTGKFIDARNTDSLNLGTGDFSIGLWIVFPIGGSSSWEGIVSKNYSTSYRAKSWGIVRKGTDVGKIAYQDVGAVGGRLATNYYSSVFSGGTHYFAVTRKIEGTNSIYKFYEDGVLKNTSTQAGIPDLTNNAPLLIGQANGRYLWGTIGELQIWKKVLSENEIKELSAMSTLQKIDSTHWILYVNKNNLADGVHNYLAYAKDVDREYSTGMKSITIGTVPPPTILQARGSFQSQPGICDTNSEGIRKDGSSLDSGEIKLLSSENTIGFYVARDDCLAEPERTKWSCTSMGKIWKGSILIGNTSCGSNIPIRAVGLSNIKANYNLKSGWLELCSETNDAIQLIVTRNESGAGVNTGKTCAAGLTQIGSFHFDIGHLTGSDGISYFDGGWAQICVKDATKNRIDMPANVSCGGTPPPAAGNCVDPDGQLRYPGAIEIKSIITNRTDSKVDYCKNSTTLFEYFCANDNNSIKIAVVDCVYRNYTKCENGACTNLTGVIETCPGIGNGPRVPIRTRINDTTARGVIKYCDPLTKNYAVTKAVNVVCSNDYECESNSCLEGKCIKLRTEIVSQGNLLKEIWCWIQGIIPGDPTKEQCRASYGLP